MKPQAGSEEAIDLIEEYEDEGWGQLPVVEDMEIAALAAEAAMEAIKLKGDSLKQLPAQSSSEDSEDESDDESMEEAGIDSTISSDKSSDVEMQDAEQAAVAVSLHVSGDGRVALQYTLKGSKAGDADSDQDSLAGSEIADPEVLREMLLNMDHDGADAKAAARELEELKAGQTPVEPLVIQLTAEDALLPNGKVTAILGDQIIVQATKSSRFVDEGSVLCTANLQPLGRVEEVFGPVEEPLYALRYACGKELPAELGPGSVIMSVEKLSTYISPDAVKGDKEEILDEEEANEFEFSDDDAEQVFQRLNGPQPSTSQPQKSAPKPAALKYGDSHVPAERGGRGRGRRGEAARPARPFAPGMTQPHEGRPVMSAGRRLEGPSRGQGRRGRGRAPGPRPAKNEAPAAPASIGPPSGSGKWVWVPETATDSPQGPAPARVPNPIRLPTPAARPPGPRGLLPTPRPGRGPQNLQGPVPQGGRGLRPGYTPNPNYLNPRPQPHLSQPLWPSGQQSNVPGTNPLIRQPVGPPPAATIPYYQQSFYPQGPP